MECGFPISVRWGLSIAEATGHVEGPAASPDASVSAFLDSVSAYGREGEARLTVRKVGQKITLDELRAEVSPRGHLTASASYDLEGPRSSPEGRATLRVTDLTLRERALPEARPRRASTTPGSRRRSIRSELVENAVVLSLSLPGQGTCVECHGQTTISFGSETRRNGDRS